MQNVQIAWFILLAAFSLGNYAEAARASENHMATCGPTGQHTRCHSHILLDENGEIVHPEIGPDVTFSRGYQPLQIRHAYGIDQLAATNNGAGKTIALVEAFDAPTIANDLAVFKRTFGITGCSLKKVNQNGGTNLPAADSGWALETSLDVEWACALAPGANLLVVEATDNSFTNLLAAVRYAAAHADVVSMSWGGGEGSSELVFNNYFNAPRVTFFASSGDGGTGVIFPSAAPNVVAVGGTTLPLDAAGNRTGAETAWAGSGGGISFFEPIPGYQLSFPIPPTGAKRATPDVSFNADPNTGVLVYDSTPINGEFGWYVVGGTSASAPSWAAITVLIDQKRTAGNLTSSNLLSSPDYNAAAPSVYAAHYHDITSGTNGTCGQICTATVGWDFVTGLGSPIANSLVPYLQTH